MRETTSDAILAPDEVPAVFDVHTGDPTAEPPDPSTRPVRHPPEPQRDPGVIERADEDEITSDEATRALLTAEGAQEQVQIQEELIEEGVEDAEELNDDLSEIIERIRREKGLPEEEPYISPIQIQYDHVIAQEQEREANEIMSAPDVEPEPEQEQEQQQEPKR